MFKVKNKNTGTTIFIINFEHILHLFLLFFFVDFEQVNASCVFRSTNFRDHLQSEVLVLL